MSRRLLVCIAANALLLMTAFPPAAHAQAQPGAGQSGSIRPALAGWVRYADTMQPAENVRVDLTTRAMQLVHTTFTRADGAFEFRSLAAGEYALEVNADGFEPVREVIELIGSSRVGIQILLRRKANAEEEPAEPAVSVRELGLPKDARSAYRRGIERLYRRGDAQGSIAQFERAISVYPEFYEAHHALGVAYVQLGQADQAERAFREAIENSQEGYAPAFVSLAGLCNNHKRYEEGLALARRATALVPENHEAHFEVSRALFALGRLSEAEVSMRETQRLEPDFPGIYLLYANLSMRKRDLDGVIVSLEEYLRLAPRGPAAENARQMLEQARKNAAAAPAQPPPES
jgi:tetratricopeptide (TPR) repeat protein